MRLHRNGGQGEEEACPRATDRPLLINFGSDRLARTSMRSPTKEPGGKHEREGAK